jgi:hypothetical protein
LVSYLQKEEFFDEVVVLWDDDMNIDNLSYFLQQYFSSRVAKFPKSRFLFAYSGHGFSDQNESYILRSSTTSIEDKGSAINLRQVRALVDKVVRSGYQVLVLLNSCYAGAFLTDTSFGGRYLPKHPGAHAITAGAASERAWSERKIGPGSVFFETLLAGLGGRLIDFPMVAMASLLQLNFMHTSDRRCRFRQTKGSVLNSVTCRQNRAKENSFF